MWSGEKPRRSNFSTFRQIFLDRQCNPMPYKVEKKGKRSWFAGSPSHWFAEPGVPDGAVQGRTIHNYKAAPLSCGPSLGCPPYHFLVSGPCRPPFGASFIVFTISFFLPTSLLFSFSFKTYLSILERESTHTHVLKLGEGKGRESSS